MPNWCESKFAFIVDDLKNKGELKRLYDNLNKACNTPCPQENDFGDSWLGHVAIIHNRVLSKLHKGSLKIIMQCWVLGTLILYHSKFRKKSNISWENKGCRGFILGIDDLNENDDYFVIEVQTAWEPPSELFDCILQQYNGVSCIYIAEEGGEGIYINTDTSGKIFPDRYILYTDDTGFLYFKDEITLINYANSYTGKTFNSFEEITDYIDNLKKSKHDICIDVYKFSEE